MAASSSITPSIKSGHPPLNPTPNYIQSNGEVSTGIYLARRLHARPQHPRQNPGQGFRQVSRRWKSSRTGASTAARPVRPRVTAPIACSSRSRVYPDTTKRNGVIVLCEVLHADRHAALHQRPRDHPGRSRHLVRLRAGIFPLQGRPSARLPRGTAIPRRRARTTPAWATRTWATSPVRSSTSTSISVSTPASTTKASTPKWPRASGNSRSSARAPRRPPTKCGSPATSCSASAKSTRST